MIRGHYDIVGLFYRDMIPALQLALPVQDGPKAKNWLRGPLLAQEKQRSLLIGTSVPRHTDCNLLSFSRPRVTFSKMSLADFVQIKGAGALL